MATSDRDRALREAFRFDASDLVANRAGRISPRQDALLGAGRRGMLLSLAVFAAVMVGSVGLVAFFDRQLQTPGGQGSIAVAAGVALVVIVAGYLQSRRYLSAAGSRKLSAAQGPAEVVSDSENDCRVRFGRTSLRLPGAAALGAFEPGQEYRVYYLAGPVAHVLSAESLSREISSRGPAAETATDAAEHETASAQIGIVRRGYVIVVVIGLLALGIPLAGFFVRDLSGPLRPFAWIGLLAVAVGFVWFAIRWLDPGKHRSS
jgi:uncharacterized membrane protein (DUF485 family)